MKRPRSRRRLALGALLAAVAVAIASFPFRATWWGGWILAVAEAGIVGGLADWFAVTALFRRPLGLPIPHTALIPANWELMAERVGVMVGNQVLTKEYVMREIWRFDVADLLARAAAGVKPGDLQEAVHAVAGWAAEQLSPAATADLVEWLQRDLRARPVTPLLATTVEIARRHGWDQRMIEAAAGAFTEALGRPDFRNAVGDVIDGVFVRYREKMGTYPGLLLDLAHTFWLIHRDRLVAALQTVSKKVADDPGDPLRQRLAEMLAALPERLRRDAALAARVEAAKNDLLESPGMARLIGDAAAELRQSLVSDLTSDQSEVAAWITTRLERARERIASDDHLRRELDHWLKMRATELIERHHDQVARFIERGVHALGPEGAVRLIEEHAGDDLQYIRLNGTVVGGLAGGALYAIHLLLHVL
jgi:uncharacterized membrane-anchored protein YjiN (DUF445 family)